MRKLLTGIWLWQMVAFGTVLQLGHFYMHGLQAWHWLFIDHTSAYMTPLGWSLSDWLGKIFVPGVCGPHVMMVGMEWMHLLLNVSFVGTLLIALRLMPNVWIERALAVELMHLGEHIALTASCMLYGVGNGWSTLFGYASVLFGHDGGIGFRVMWHFLINFAPTGLMAWGMYKAARVRIANGEIDHTRLLRDLERSKGAELTDDELRMFGSAVGRWRTQRYLKDIQNLPAAEQANAVTAYALRSIAGLVNLGA